MPSSTSRPASASSADVGERPGVLFLHGFTSSPASVQDWADFVAQHGYRTRVPLLAGHGTTWGELAHTTFEDWYASALEACRELRDECGAVAVAGLSMGGTLSLRLGVQEDVAALILVNPGLHIPQRLSDFASLLKRVLPSIGAIGSDIKKPGVREEAYERVPVAAVEQLHRLFSDTRAHLPALKAPMLVFRSTEDNVVNDLSLEMLLDSISTPERERTTVQWLPRSRHVATVDYDAETIFQSSVNFLDQLALPSKMAQ